MKVLKIEPVLKKCPNCGVVNAKKEKQGKGLPPILYCPKCGLNL